MSEEDYKLDVPTRRSRAIRDEYSTDSLEEEAVDVDVAPDENGSDSDMFASDKEDSKVVVKKNQPTRLNMDQFERELQVDASEQNQEEDDDVQLEAFNLREEEEDGYFDEDGNFIRHPQSNDDEPEDELLDVDKHEIEKARRAQEVSRAQRTSTTRINETTAELLEVLISNLEPDESPLEALARLGPTRKKRNKRAIITDQELEKKQLVIQLTDICDKLMIHKGMVDLYDMVREELMRLYKRETGEDFKISRGVKRQHEDSEESEKESERESEDYGEKIWEFKWHDLEDINGPYSNYEMSYWKDNYFDHKVDVRKVGEEKFVHIDDITFDV